MAGDGGLVLAELSKGQIDQPPVHGPGAARFGLHRDVVEQAEVDDQAVGDRTGAADVVPAAAHSGRDTRVACVPDHRANLGSGAGQADQRRAGVVHAVEQQPDRVVRGIRGADDPAGAGGLEGAAQRAGHEDSLRVFGAVSNRRAAAALAASAVFAAPPLPPVKVNSPGSTARRRSRPSVA